MSEKDAGKTRTHHHRDVYASSLTTEQMRTVGQRREAEVKLEHQLEEARHKDGTRDDHAVNEETGAVNSHNVPAIQNDDRLTAADRADSVPNQLIASDNNDGARSETRHAP